MKRTLFAITITIAYLITFTTVTTASDAPDYKVVIHVDENNPKLMNLALNNVANVNKYYDSVGETVEIELIAYGPCGVPPN